MGVIMPNHPSGTRYDAVKLHDIGIFVRYATLVGGITAWYRSSDYIFVCVVVMIPA